MVKAMCTCACIVRSIRPRVIGLLRRSLMVAGLLFGFLLAGSALAHAETKPPPAIPALGIGPIQLPHVPDVPALTDTVASAKHTIKSVTKVVTPVTKVVTPVTKVVTSLTTDVTTTVVRTISPVVRPAVGMTAPVLAPVLSPPPARSRPTVTTQSTTPDVDPIAVAPPAPAQSVPAQPATVPTTQISVVVQPQVLPVNVLFVPAIPSATKLSSAPSPRVPLDDDRPIMDVTGGNSTCGSSTTGQMFGISRAFFGVPADRLAGIGIRPGGGPPKWWFFDPRHHPS
jgi:hypothetical protein